MMCSLSFVLSVLLAYVSLERHVITLVQADNILMVTMGGTKSHTVLFTALSRALVSRGHNVTLMSGFPGVAADAWATELTPPALYDYITTYTKDLDLLGRRFRGETPMNVMDAVRYGLQVCSSTLQDDTFQAFLNSRQTFDLVIMDSSYVSCAVGLAYYFQAPFMYINTIGFYTGPLAAVGNPETYAITPFFNLPYSDVMNIWERSVSAFYHMLVDLSLWLTIKAIQPMLRNTFGQGMPNILDMQRNVSFVLQNSHPTLTYPRAYLPNVAEVACLHCHEARPLPQDLESFVSGAGIHGVIVFSMGSSVRTSDMPSDLRRVFIKAFARLPHRIVWKWEGKETHNASHISLIHDDIVPPNVKLVNWLPQQDLLGHPNVLALVSHGGLFSMFETAYHGKPMVTIPVFCDHDVNAVKAESDGYAVRLELQSLTSNILHAAITKVIKDPRYRENAKLRSRLLRDQPETPLERAVFWTEYVVRHRGAPHWRGAAVDLGIVKWLYLDVFLFLVCGFLIAKRVMPQLISKSSSTATAILYRHKIKQS